MSSVTRRRFLSDAVSLGGAGVACRMAPMVGGVTGFGAALAQDVDSTDEIGFRTALELAELVRDKAMSSVELTSYFIDRIGRYDERLNAVVVRDFDRALESARNADRAIAREEALGPLHGVPMTIKESYNIAGLPTTWGIPAFADNVADSDAVVVSHLKAAGAHFMGKTNVPFALSDFQSYNDLYGTTNNPWNLGRTPGGSSGGTAVALAAGLTALDCGSDIGGSIRNPAHFCGVYGHKPTWGIVPREGHSLGPGSTPVQLAVSGPLARSAEDLDLALRIVAGPSRLNEPGWQLSLPEARASSLDELRVAVWPTDNVSPVDQPIVDRIQDIADLLARRGATVSDAARPAFDAQDANNTYLSLLWARWGSPVPDDVYEANRSTAARYSVDDMSTEAVSARGAVMTYRDWLGYSDEQNRIQTLWKAFFEDWDILLCPIAVTTAFPHDHSPQDQRTLDVNGTEVPYLEQIFWAGLANLGNLPGTVFPTGLSEDELPIGVQALGAEFDDRTTIEFARLMSRELGGFRPPSGYSG